jgi:hypothetical protein
MESMISLKNSLTSGGNTRQEEKFTPFLWWKYFRGNKKSFSTDG